MKTITEFSGFQISDAIQASVELAKSGKTPEELSQSLGEKYKYDGDKLKFFLNAIEVAKTKPKHLKRIVILSLNEGEKVPNGAVEKDGNQYVVEYFFVPQPKRDRNQHKKSRGKHRRGRRRPQDGSGRASDGSTQRNMRANSGEAAQSQAKSGAGESGQNLSARTEKNGEKGAPRKKRWFSKKPRQGGKPKEKPLIIIKVNPIESAPQGSINTVPVGTSTPAPDQAKVTAGEATQQSNNTES